MSRALQMPSQPQVILQAVASYKCSNEAVSTRKKYSSASPESTQNVKKTHLLTCDCIACSRLVSLTSVGLMTLHVCVRSIALHQVKCCFRKHQLCTSVLTSPCSLVHSFPYILFLQSPSARSSPTHLLLCLHFTYPDFIHPL